MSAIMSVDDFASACRVCLSREECSTDIFLDKCSNDETYASILMKCANVTIAQNDGLPTKICQVCTSNIETYISLISKCLESNLFLNNIIHGVIIKNEDINQDIKISENFNERLDDSPSSQKCNQYEMPSIKPYKCSICSEAFDDMNSLGFHLCLHYRENLFKCDKCLNMFKYEQDLKEHVCVYTKNVHKCDKCGLEFYDKDSLNTHMCINSVGSYRCDLCNTEFDRNENLMKHTCVYNLYKCSHCQRSFETEYLLEIHSLAHAENIPPKCDYCNKTFKDNGPFLAHMYTHTQELPFKCEFCGKSFKYKRFLRIHMRTHTENVYKCRYCEQNFKYKRLLDKHRQTHTQMQPTMHQEYSNIKTNEVIIDNNAMTDNYSFLECIDIKEKCIETGVKQEKIQ